MIECKPSQNGNIEIAQQIYHPWIFLDQWMWSRLGHDCNLRNDLISIGKKKQVTIAYSMLSFFELCQITDASQFESILETINAFDYSLIDCNPLNVAKRERMHGGFAASFDPLLIRRFCSLMINGSLKGNLPAEYLVALMNNLKLDRTAEIVRIKKRIQSNFNPIIKRARMDIRVRLRAKNRKALGKRQKAAPCSIDSIISHALDYIALASDMTMDSNSWIDMMQMIVSIRYLDLVLLDGRWYHFVKQELPYAPPEIAKVYSPREVNAFIHDLKQYETN